MSDSCRSNALACKSGGGLADVPPQDVGARLRSSPLKTNSSDNLYSSRQEGVILGGGQLGGSSVVDRGFGEDGSRAETRMGGRSEAGPSPSGPVVRYGELLYAPYLMNTLLGA
ncbi:hypothetical protein LTR70_004558 [Exophiala xenobiotica]|nr:hypothetical protein LTR70_004558 [Exophiala xenobiotica]